MKSNRFCPAKIKDVLIITGPCSVHDETAALEYAEKLCQVKGRRSKDTFAVIMRVYFEKPRTSIGWKGLINDPYMDDSRDLMEGLRRARKLLLGHHRHGHAHRHGNA